MLGGKFTTLVLLLILALNEHVMMVVLASTTTPTTSPTSTPEPTQRPKPATKQPSNFPTKIPKTAFPSHRPSEDTDRPTPTPQTDSPTKRATDAPTKIPRTMFPSQRPTEETNRPTRIVRTMFPSQRPTDEADARTGAPSKRPSNFPTKIPRTMFPSQRPTIATDRPTKRPTPVPTRFPNTLYPTRIQPTQSPSLPTLRPSDSPSTLAPSVSPTQLPSHAPSTSPSKAPTMQPTLLPTKLPTLQPTLLPTLLPTQLPTRSPTIQPTLLPTRLPTLQPTLLPTLLPTHLPTRSPTQSPTRLPTKLPTLQPTLLPTLLPTKLPTRSPSHSPTRLPTKLPTLLPTRLPTLLPTKLPTRSPTQSPTRSPSRTPTRSPSHSPTKRPTHLPTRSPTHSPSHLPTHSPTKLPTQLPTASPTRVPCPQLSSYECGVEIERCEWIVANDVEYGCQNRGFCGVGKLGTRPKAQCDARSMYCTWSSSSTTCVSNCPAGAPPKKHTALPTTCAKLSLVDTIPRSKAVKFTENVNLAHFGSAVAGDGDFDGDGKPDFAIGSPDLPPKFSVDRDGTGGIHLFLSATGEQHVKFSLNGTELEGQFGASLALVDLDGDGLHDLVVGAPHTNIRSGTVFVIWGRRNFAQAHARGEYADLAKASLNYVVRLEANEHQGTFGSALTSAGDFDGDGIKDLAIAARASSVDGRPYCGQVYIIFGTRDRTKFAQRALRITAPNAFSNFGTGLAGGRDFNGDGYDDVAIGAPWASSGLGEVFVVFGRPQVPSRLGETLLDLYYEEFWIGGQNVDPTLPRVWNFAHIKPPAGDARNTWPNFGASISLPGDVNVDGVEDLVIGAPGHNGKAGERSGIIYVLYGKAGQKPVAVLPVQLDNSESGFAAEGMVKQGEFGYSLSPTPVDFDGDGYADILVGSPGLAAASGTVANKGAVTLIYGRCNGFPAKLNLDQAHSVTVFTHPTAIVFGYSVSSAGVVNNDGRTSLLAGAPLANTNERGLAELIHAC